MVKFYLYLIICFFFFFQDEDDMKKIGIEKINQLLDSFLGINDTELGKNIYTPFFFFLA